MTKRVRYYTEYTVWSDNDLEKGILQVFSKGFVG